MARNKLHRQANLAEMLHLDLPLFVGILACFALGLLVLYSAKMNSSIVHRQIIRLIIACGMMLVVAQIPPRAYRFWAPWFYFSTLIMLGMVLLVGDVSKGAQRWLDFKFIRFQPAEIMKLALPLMLCRTLDEHVLPPKGPLIALSSLYIFLPLLLIAMQPDLGTAILVASTGFFVLFFAGISWRFLATIASLALAALPFFWSILRSYQKQRILTLLNPERDPLGAGYHIIQSKIAIGSGGIFGKGWLHGTQSHLEFLPERTTDFIFAVFGEEFGFVGVVVLLLIYSFIIFRGLQIGANARDTFSRLLAGSLIMTFCVYITVNIGMVSGILPVVGIPLPLISYGGTSMVTIMLSFGMLMAIETHKTLLKK